MSQSLSATRKLAAILAPIAEQKPVEILHDDNLTNTQASEAIANLLSKQVAA